jgi:hypothetical protein
LVSDINSEAFASVWQEQELNSPVARRNDDCLVFLLFRFEPNATLMKHSKQVLHSYDVDVVIVVSFGVAEYWMVMRLVAAPQSG